MNTTYRYRPGPEQVCRVCSGFIRWPDGIRLMCRCTTPEPCEPSPEHAYWQVVPYRTWTEERNECEGWRDGNALDR